MSKHKKREPGTWLVRAAFAALAVSYAAFGLQAVADATRHHDTTPPVVPLQTSAVAFYGNPDAGAPYWQWQTVGDCVEQSVRIAVDEVKHVHLKQSAVDKEAEALHVFLPQVGTYSAAWPNLLAHYGVHYQGPMATSKKHLEALLKNGYVVIATLNAETIWRPFGYVTAANDFTRPDHALVVDAISGDGKWVYLTDTGVPAGAHEVVPWSTFSTAWATGGYSATAVSR